MEEVKINGMIDGKLTVALSGDIHSGNADEFYERVAAAYDEQPADLFFDGEKLNFIDSTALGVFVKLLKKAKADGHTLTLCALQAKIKKLFVICSLDSIMEIL